MKSISIKSYTPGDWPQIAPLVAMWPFKPMASLNRFDQSHLFDFACGRLHKALNHENSRALTAVVNNQIRGLACFNMLAWDSRQLGRPAGRIEYLLAQGSYHRQLEIKRRLLAELRSLAEAEGIIHLSVRVDASDFSSLHALESSGFHTMDTILTFAIDLKKSELPKREHDFNLRLATANDSQALSALAKTIFVYDRFHSDPSITRDQADELHAAWLRDSCEGKACDAVFVAEDESGLLGFVSCRLERETQSLGQKIGTVILIGSARQARGRGVARAVLAEAVAWMRHHGCDVVESGTQVRNVPSIRLFTTSGFTVVGSSVSLRTLCVTDSMTFGETDSLARQGKDFVVSYIQG